MSEICKILWNLSRSGIKFHDFVLIYMKETKVLDNSVIFLD